MIDTLIDIAKNAGEIILEVRKTGFTTQTKSGPHDFVTDADKKSEAYILERLRKEFPADSILSEESGLDDKGSSRVWIVDPLDGTKDFRYGGSGFSVVIGLCVDKIPVLGVVHDPLQKKTYYAQKGKGAFVREDNSAVDKPLHVSTQTDLAKATMIIRIPHGEQRNTDTLENAFAVKQTVGLGSVGLKLSMIAAGEADFTVITTYRTSEWDTCGPQVILEEAGGLITDLDGNGLPYSLTPHIWSRLFLASNRSLHEAGLKVLSKVPLNKV